MDQKPLNMIKAGFAAAGAASLLLPVLFFMTGSRFFLYLQIASLVLLLFFGIRMLSYIKKYDMEKEQIALRLADEESRAARAELRQKKQELRALQSQINPHFFYNTLDTFRGYAIEHQNYELSTMIAALSGMFKYSMNYGEEIVTVNSEMNYLKKYIQIQQLRFPGRFTYEERILCDPEELLTQLCPRFVLQPLVENAIRHGLNDMTSGGRICTTYEMTDDTAVITVEDNGCGMDEKTLLEINRKLKSEAEEPGSGDGGIGIYNVNERIRLFCGPEYGLHFAATKGEGTQVTVRLPRGDIADA